MQKNKKILMVAFHFPPYRMSSGIQRTLKFSTYLREYGWDPMILSISPRAYDVVNPDQLKEIPEDIIVERAWGLDTARQLSFRGKYLRWMAQPDRWASWWLGGMRTGMQMIRKHRPDVLFSTFPIATAHMIGLGLSKRSGLPWVADFRDAMTEDGYPRDPLTWRVQRKLEAASVEQCTKALFTTQLTREMYAKRYPNIAESKWGVVENGYDEDNFLDALTDIEDAPLGKPNQITLVHSGILYPKERDPRPFFAAIAGLKREGVISADTLQVVLRATGSDDLYRPQLISHGIEDIVRLEPVVAYRDALREMLRADGLLLFQGSVCNHQIPAKIYEYYRTGKPIFALVDFAGISAKMLDETGGAHLVDMAEMTSIARGLKGFIQKLHSGDCAGVSRSLASAHSRKARTFELARILDEIVDSRKIIA